MKDAQPGTIYLKDYRPPDFLIPRTELEFSLYEDRAEVSARLWLTRNDEASADAPLELHGQELDLLSLSIDGRELTPDEYEAGPQHLRIPAVPDEFELHSRVAIEREVWGDVLPDSDTLRSHMYNLRKVIDKPFDRQLLHTVHGSGYRIAVLDSDR